MLQQLRTVRWSAWLAWQMESNWTSPWLFGVYVLAKPLAATLLLVCMYWAADVATGGGIAPGFLPFLYISSACYLLVGGVTFGMSEAVVADREKYGMLKYVRISPAWLPSYLIGRGLSRAAVAVLGALLAVGIGMALLSEVRAGLGREGIEWGWLLAYVLLGTLMLLSLGLILAGAVLNLPRYGMFLSEAVAGVLYLLSGVVFPVSVLPGWLQPLSLCLPTTYWLEGMRRALLGADVMPSPLADWGCGQIALALLASTLGLALFARWFFRRCERRAWRLGLAREALVETKHRLGDPPPRRVVILRALQLGDTLCAVPAFRALRHALPRAKIVLVGLPWGRLFVERFRAYLDGFRLFPGWPGMAERPAQLGQIPGLLADLQREQFDLAIQMHGSGGITNPLTVLFGAKANAGYYAPGQFCPDAERFLPYPDDLPEIRRHLRLAEFLGAAPQGEHLEFPVAEADRCEVQALGDELPPRGYVCLHPGARSGQRWAPAGFAAVGDALAARGLRVVLTGSAEERDVTGAVAAAMRATALDLAGRTTLGGLAALLEGARLLVSNDTGVAHLAAALRLPSVILFNPAMIARWAPLDRQRHRPLPLPAEAADVLREVEALPDL